MDATVLIIQKSSDVNELSTSTLTISNESFLMSTEVQLTENLNRTTEGTDRYSKILDVINPSTTPPKHIETTLEITDVQVRENLNDTVKETERYSNITTDITKKNQQNELLWSVEQLKVLLNRLGPLDRPKIEVAPTHLTNDAVPGTYDEISMAIRQIMCNKAGGSDKIPAETLKAELATNAEMLHIISSKICDIDHVRRDRKQ
ncbi:unnamed protein product [Schistosoma curassoni]|uniref:Uncharacterized protein n=1 Tax=Schistosoma curassoni TaxID=6186 RepID=A0A183JZZ5_9TREM|nr:unnamed protein product [Schistosoma curassoni]